MRKGMKMKHQLKRILCIAAGMALTAGSLPHLQTVFPGIVLTASAADHGQCGISTFWRLDNGVLTISGDSGINMFVKDPPWAPYRDEIRRVIIQDGVTDIKGNAFASCSALTDIRFPMDAAAILSRLEVPYP